MICHTMYLLFLACAFGPGEPDILLIGSGAVLIWRQPLWRVWIIELVLAGCLIAPWLE